MILKDIFIMKGISKNDILKCLTKLGIKPGMSLEVHSSLKSFGYVDGGAETVILALIESVGEKGGIVMPSQLLSKRLPLTPDDTKNGLTMKLKVLDPEADEDSGMGLIADTFRRRSDVITGKGRHRVSAWGKDAHINGKGFGNLIKNDQWALLIGVDIYRLSSMHYVEGNKPDDINAVFRPTKEILEIYHPDEWYVETGSHKVKAWYKIQDRAYENGSIKDCIIGDSKCMFFKINDVIRLYEKALIENPYGLYGVKV